MWTHFAVFFEDTSLTLQARKVEGVERIGEPSRHELDLFANESVEPSAVLGKGCVIQLANELGGRTVAGIVTRFTRIATSQLDGGRRYRAVVEPWWALLRHRKGSRVHQHVTVPDLIKRVLVEAGLAADKVETHLGGSHPEREYVVQWMEDDLAFIRRLAEDEGLYFHASPAGDGHFVIADTSSAADAFSDPLTVTDGSGLVKNALVAYHPRVASRRRPGKVTLKDHDPDKPALALDGKASAGTAVEKDTEVYHAPGGFRSPADGDKRAKTKLESLRAEAKRIVFETNALGLAPGLLVKLEHGADYPGTPSVEGDYLVVGVAVRSDPAQDHVAVEVIPKETAYRLGAVTPRPRIAGVQVATVTGPAGAEIHPDDKGRVFVRFAWDRLGPTDETSSLPIRVLQPNTPGSMVLPRVGWEVAVAFEDGDPDRPYVLGRVYNAKTPPPVALPANKTMTMLRTWSSPGAGVHNTVSFDDASGRQALAISAGFAKTTSVANNMMVQTLKVEEQKIGASQTVTVGADDDLTVKEALLQSMASQTATVGGTQKIFVKGNLSHTVGSESVVVGAALLEKVGDPVKGALNLGVNAALAGAGALGSTLGPVGQVATTVATTAAGIGWGMYQAATAPGAGPNAARDAGIRGLIGAGADRIPGGDALFASVTGGGRTLPWESPPAGGGGAEAGGGAGGAVSNSAAAAGPGPGHRSEVVKGPYTELIGGALVVTTPGNVKWQTTSMCNIAVGGAHTTKAVSVGVKVLGASEEALGSLFIKAKTTVGRTVKGAIATTVAGSLKVNAKGGVYSAKAGSKITLDATGALKCTGGVVVFVVGSSVVAASSGGVLVKAGTIKINGATKQSGDTTH
jgi:type VI secretion system secreted protein VgrG